MAIITITIETDSHYDYFVDTKEKVKRDLDIETESIKILNIDIKPSED